jgi:hypothetical protein
MRSEAAALVARAQANWRGAIWIAVALLAVGLGIGASIIGRVGVAPSAAESTARDFIAAWNNGDYRSAYADLDTTLSASDFVSALQSDAAPVRDARVEAVERQDDQQAVISYSASVPEALAAVSGLVVADSRRYAPACVDANARGARYVRVTDKLIVQHNAATGGWRIDFRRDPSSRQQAGAIALAYDLSQRIFYNQLGPSVDPKSAGFADQVIATGLNLYQRDVGALPTEDATLTSADQVRQRVAGLATSCGRSG